MAIQIKRDTAKEFEKFINLPENVDKLFEFIGGEVVEVPSNPYSSQIATRISTYIGMYLLKNNIGHLTGEAGGYRIGGERYAPDVAFIAKEKQSHLPAEGYNPNPPDLAVEVVSPSDSERLLSIKIGNYLACETTVWVVRPDVAEVEIYRPGQPVKIVAKGGALDGGNILPGFTLALNDIFPQSG